MSKKILDSHRVIWNKRELTRYLYSGWYREIVKELSGEGLTIELGAGTGNFKEYMPASVATDLVCCEWLDIVHDAMALPYRDSSVGNFVLIDAIHHIHDPVRALAEMERCLKKGGRIVIFDVFISPFSYLYYNYFHKEKVDLNADLFTMSDAPALKEPFESNQAIATLLFFKDVERFVARFPGLRPVKRAVREFLLYPMSGGFEGVQLVPFCLRAPMMALDNAVIKVLGRYAAGRCLIVIEKAV